MLLVRTNQNDFEYDIHSLIRAFYPGQEVKLVAIDHCEPGATGDGVAGCSEPSATGDGVADHFESTATDTRGGSVTPEALIAGADGALPAVSIRFTPACIELEIGAGGASVSGSAAIDPAMKRIEVKNALKQLLYRGLVDYTGRKLPWGALTGIRPVKLPMGLLEQGMDDDAIMDHMAAVYLAGEEKSRLALNIAKLERSILSALDYREGYSIYIGIPFCPTTCLYCSFTSYPIAGWRKRVDEYLTALVKELDYTAAAFAGRPCNSIYIGGGTPTTLEPEQLERLLGAVGARFDMSSVREYTVEAGRADSITAAKLDVLKQYGVNRISINPQTMKEATLKLIGRQHTVGQVKEAFQLARSKGFDNINMDLILGLPEETAADVVATMAAVGELRPDGLTIHSLAVKRAAGLNRWIDENGMDSLHNTDETMSIAMDGAESLGMHPYYLYRQKNMAGNFENIGYATLGHYGIYNILMMEDVQSIVALGAGSVSKRVHQDGSIERRDNVKDVGLYLERIDEMIERKRALFG
jgi:oxygen-independent coproporphyrinogen-3 oxidase